MDRTANHRWYAKLPPVGTKSSSGCAKLTHSGALQPNSRRLHNMEPTDKSEILRRFAVVLKQLSSPRYPLAITAHVETDHPSELDGERGMSAADCPIVIGEKDRWEGDLLASVLLSDLHLNEDFAFAISPLLHERGELVD